LFEPCLHQSRWRLYAYQDEPDAKTLGDTVKLFPVPFGKIGGIQDEGNAFV